MSSNKDREKIIVSVFEHLRLLIEDFSKKIVDARYELNTLKTGNRNEFRLFDEKRSEIRSLNAWLKEFDCQVKTITSLLDSIRHEDSFIDDIYDYLATGPIDPPQDFSFERFSDSAKLRNFKEEKVIETNESINFMEAFIPDDHNSHEFELMTPEPQIQIRKSARIIERYEEQKYNHMSPISQKNRIIYKPIVTRRERNKIIRQNKIQKRNILADIYNEYDDEKLMNGYNSSSNMGESIVSQDSIPLEGEITGFNSGKKEQDVIKIVKRSRGVYTRWSEDFKARIIQEIQVKKLDINEISKAKGVPKKNIGRWLKFGPQRKKGGGRKTQDPAMEMSLKKWVDMYIEIHKLFPQRSMIKTQAKRMSRVDKFKASKGWLDKFLKRTGLDKVLRHYQIPIDEDLELKTEVKMASPEEAFVFDNIVTEKNIEGNEQAQGIEIFSEDY